MRRKKQSSEKTSQAGGRVRRYRYPILFVIVCLVHANSIYGVFLFDDTGSIHANGSIRNLVTSIVDFPKAGIGETVEGRPILNFSLAVNYAISELQPWSYHVLNILIHAFNAILLGALIELVLSRLVTDESLKKSAWAIAFMTAVVWGVHPLTTQCVAYIVQRAESMASMFYLLGFYAFVRSALAEKDRAWGLLAVFSCWFGMATKEIVATLPVLLVIFDYLFLAATASEVFKKRGSLHLGMFIGTGLLAALILFNGARGGSIGAAEGISVVEYATTQVWAVGRYLQLVVWPFPQIFDYGYGLVPARELLPQAIPLLIELLISLILVFRYPRAGFTGIAFFLILAPTSSFLPINTQTISEHRMYLPLAAVLLQIVLIVYWSFRRLPGWSTAMSRLAPVGWIGATVLIALPGIATVNRNRIYHSEMAIWPDVISKRPGNSRAYYSIGRVYLRENDLAGAIREFGRGLEVDPDSVKLLVFRGHARFDSNDTEGAIEDFDRVIEIEKGTSATAYERRGFFRYYLKQHELAELDFKAALKIDPDLADANVHRGQNLEALGRFEEAIECFSNALQKEVFAETLYFRGNLYLKTGNLEGAYNDFNHAVELEPNNPLGYVGRGYTFLNMQMFDEARADAERAKLLGIEPDPDFLKSLAPK